MYDDTVMVDKAYYNKLIEQTTWISVKDRLPEKKDYVYWRTDDLFYVLCYVKRTGKMYLAFKDGKYWQDRHGNRLGYVTHWRPLPEPPESEDEE